MGVIRTRIKDGLSPWTASVTGDIHFEVFIIGWFAAFMLLRYAVLLLPSAKNELFKKLAERPTIVPVMVHSLISTIAAFAIVVPLGEPTEDTMPLKIYAWRRGVLSFSCAYWLFDLLYYCYPKGDWLIAVHHIASTHRPLACTRARDTQTAANEIMPNCPVPITCACACSPSH